MSTVILGSGLTGLVSAFLLSERNQKVVIVDSAPTAGGLLRCFSFLQDVPLENFYHYIFPHDLELHWLLSRMGLSDRVSYHHALTGNYSKGKVWSFGSAMDVMRFGVLCLKDRVRLGISSFQLIHDPRLTSRHQERALDWFRKSSGERATEALWEPLLESKFGRQKEEVSLAWMAGRVRQRGRSRKQGREELGYLNGSHQILIDALVTALKDRGVSFLLGNRVKRLKKQPKGFDVILENGTVLSARRIIATVPSPVLSSLVKPLDSTYSDTLNKIEYVGAVCVVVRLRERLGKIFWMNVTDSDQPFGGIIEHTNLVSPSNYHGRSVVYLSRYLDSDHPLWNQSDEELIAKAIHQLSVVYTREVEPLREASWVYRAKHASPCFINGFDKKVPKFASPIPELFVANMPQVYPDERSANNCVRLASQVVTAMGFDVREVPRGISLAGDCGV